MRLLIGTLFLFLASPLWAQLGAALDNPLQAQLDFEEAFVTEVEQVGDTNRLTSAQKKQAWTDLETRLIAKLGVKPWTITLRVADVRPDSKSDRIHQISFEPTISLPGSRCSWRFGGSIVKLPIDKTAAAKIHKGDYLTFTGVPLKVAEGAPKAKQLEYERRIKRGLAIPVTIQHDKAATFSLVVAELKYNLTK